MKFWREKPGVISEGPCWCYEHEGYLYIADTFPALLKVLATEWRHDRHLVG